MKRRTRRWGRILFNTLTAISLLLAIATAGLWVRSVRYFSVLSWLERSANPNEPNRAVADHALRLVEGRLSYTVTSFNANVSAGFFNWRFGEIPRDSAERLAEGAFIIAGPPPLVDVSCPLAIPIVTLMILPSIHLYRWVSRKRRQARGLCPACGYDTRANPAKCSECGQEMPVTTKVESP